MKIAIDVDGVTVNLIDEWLRRYNHDYEDHLKAEDITDWDTSLFVKPECGKQIYDYLNDEFLYHYAKPIQGSLEGINFLRDCGHDIVFASACTAFHMLAKYQWLMSGSYIKDMSEYMVVTKKSFINADILIDDRTKNLQEFSGNGILFSQPWNIKDKYAWKADTWEQVCLMVNGLDKMGKMW